MLEFTPDVAHFMQLADFFIGKPGPGSLSEAVQLHLPVIVTRNRWTLPQERYNVQWVKEQGVGLVCSSFTQIDQAVEALMAGLAGYREATQRMQNRAIFEVPSILERIMLEAGNAVKGRRGVALTVRPEVLR